MANPYGHPYGLPPGMSANEVADMLTALGIGDVATYTVDTLPLPGSYPRRTAWVSDLFADQPIPGGRVVSEGGYWKPIRPLATASPVVTGRTALALTPLLHSPTQVLTGAVAAGVGFTLSYSTVNAYPGARFRTIRKATGGLGSTMTLLGSLIPLGSWVDHEFDPSTNTWVQTASGGLL